MTKSKTWHCLHDTLAPKLAIGQGSNILILNKSTAISTSIARSHLDYLGIKNASIKKTGKSCGEWRFFGLYSVCRLTLLAGKYFRVGKIRFIVQKRMWSEHHKGKNLKHILNSYPREWDVTSRGEGFSGQWKHSSHSRNAATAWFSFVKTSMAIPKCIGFSARDLNNTERRNEDARHLTLKRCATVTSLWISDVQFSQLVLGPSPKLHHFKIAILKNKAQHRPAEDIQRKMQDAMSLWEDKLLNALHKSHGDRKRQHFIFNDYVPYLPPRLREDFSQCGRC